MLPVSPYYAEGNRLSVSIELTNICNFTCPFCPQAYKNKSTTPGGSPYNRRQGMITEEVFHRALSECNRTAARLELGFFGEQTLHKHYVSFLHELRQRNFSTELNTNVSFVTEAMMRTWIDVGIDLVRLSLDAVHSDVFNRTRPGQVRDLNGAIVSTDARMQAINEKVHLWLSMPDHAPTRLVFVKSSSNVSEQEAFINYWQSYLGEDDHILIKQVLSYGGKINDPLVEPANRCNVWEMRYLMIDWQGNVSPCNLDTNMDLTIGNIMQDSIDAIYNGPVALRLRNQTGCLRDITPCRTCKDGNNWSRNEVYKRKTTLSEKAGPVSK